MRAKIAAFLFCCVIPGGLAGCDMRGTHEANGYVESENLYLTSPYSGTLKNLAVVRGASIKKGDLVFALDPNPEAIKIAEIDKVLEQEKASLEDLKAPRRKPEIGIAAAEISQIESRLKLSKLRMKRFKDLYIKNAGTLDDSDAARYLFTELEALKEQKKFALALTMLGAREGQILSQAAKVSSVKARKAFFEWELAQKTRYAPGDAIIFDTYFLEGEWVPAGKPVAALLLLSSIDIEFFVSAEQLGALHLGQSINVTCAGCPKKNKATIYYISPEAEYVPPLVYSRSNYDRLVFRVRAKPLHPKHFKPGQPVTVSGF